MRRRYRQLDDWLDAHPVAEFVFLAAVPGFAFALAHLWLSGEGLERVAILGVVFGLTFAVVTVLGRRVLGK